jgi:predicted nucleotidyltransferase
MNFVEKRLLFKFSQEMPGARVLGFFVVGSHLFNLNGANSDKDYFGIYMPSKAQLDADEKFNKNKEPSKRKDIWPKQLNLGTNQTNQKNNKDDVDCKFFSLDEYLRLLADSDFNMLEMLYAPKDKVLVSSLEYEELVMRREMFTPFDLSSFVGFVKGEARLHLVDKSSYEKYAKFVDFLKTLPPMDKMTQHFSKLEVWNNKEKVGYCTTSLISNNSKRVPSFKLASSEYQSPDRVKRWLDQAETKLSKYGSRQKQTAEDGAAYKALYHALRLLFEAEDLLHYGRLNLPFDERRHKRLKDVKEGRVPKKTLFPLVLKHLHYVDKVDQDRKINQMHRLAAKHDEFRDWVAFYFYNKKMKVLLTKDKTNHLMKAFNYLKNKVLKFYYKE